MGGITRTGARAFAGAAALALPVAALLLATAATAQPGPGGGPPPPGPATPVQQNELVETWNGRIIVAGGRTGPGAMAERVDAVEIYDPATRRWTRGAPLPAPRAASPGRSMPAACSSSAARASGPTCWA